MSDYFTNLVMRSFSPVTAVQPLGVSPYVTPAAAENSLTQFSDPFVEAIKLDDEIAEPAEVTPERNSLGSQPARPEVTTEKPPLASVRAIRAAPVANSRSDTIISAKPESSSNFAAAPGRYNPPSSEDAKPQLQDVPLNSESKTSQGKSRSLDKLSEIAAPNQKALGTVVPDHRPSPQQRLAESSSDPVEPESSAEGFPQEIAVRSRLLVAKPAVVEHEHVHEREQIDANASPWRLVKKSVKASQLSPQTTPAQPIVRLETVSEVSRSVAPLIPKISTQALLPVNIKSRQTLDLKPATYQGAHRVLPEETIINVAIGRIEVRATPGESSKRERQLKGPRVMDLDDYARQRSRGNR